jgi:hypothetical protein
MANYDFNADIIVGEDGEDVVIKDLKSLGGIFVSNNKDNRYDVIMNLNNKEVKYEIKTDVFCRPDNDTGNIFVEFECRGKFSGLLVTEAKWFVTYYKHLREIWYIQTDVLKKIITENTMPRTEFSGDENSNTKGWLVPRYQYKKHFLVRKVPKD